MKKKKILIALICLFVVLLSSTIFVSFSSNTEVQPVRVKSIIPSYDENSDVLFKQYKGKYEVIFNDKDQSADYKVVIENTQNYDVQIKDITLTTPTEEFLDYKVEDIGINYVLKAHETKELTVHFETTGIKGWGRNFTDELITKISFDKKVKDAEVEYPAEDNEEQENQPEPPASDIKEVISKTEKNEINKITKNTIEFKEDTKLVRGDKVAVWIYSKTIFLGYFDVVEENGVKKIEGLEDALKKVDLEAGEQNIVLSTDEQEVLGYISVYVNEDKEVLTDNTQESTDKEESSSENNTTTKPGTSSSNKTESNKEDKQDNEKNPYTGDNILLVVLISATSITGLAIIIVSKSKFTQYTILILMLSPAFTITNAEEVIEVSIKNNVSFESQNVMKTAYSSIDYDGYPSYQDYWQYRGKIKNIFINNENNEIQEYTHKFDVTEEGNGRVIAYLVANTDDSNYYDLYLQADGIIYPNTDASWYFADMEYLDTINNLSGIDTSEVTNMNEMFNSAGYISENFNLDLSSFDTSNVTNMSHMFYKTGYDSTNFTLDVSNFDTSKVTDMSYMFYETGDNSTNFTLDVSNFDTSKVTDMSYMFYETGYSSKNFTLDVSNFNTSKVTDMSNMFYGTGSNSKNLTLDLSGLDTSKVTDMSSMFERTGYNSENFNLDLSSFDTSNVTNMNSMFRDTANNNPNFTLDVSNFDTSNVRDMSYMFYNTGYNSNKFKTSITIKNPNPKYYTNMFYGVAIKEGSQITVNYTFETKDLIDNIISGKSSDSNVVKGNLIVDVDNLSTGDEIHVSNEQFNVISQTDNTITLLAQQTLGTDYKQTTSKNGMQFADIAEWEAESGPKEIDIQTWSTNPKTYVNAYVEYLKEELGDNSVTGDLITLNELESLGCTISEDYSYNETSTCYGSPYYGWLINKKGWWTKSAVSNHTTGIWFVGAYGAVYANDYHYSRGGIRPVITVSKEKLKDYINTTYGLNN